MRRQRLILAFSITACTGVGIACADGPFKALATVGPLEIGEIDTRSATGPIKGFWAKLDTTNKDAHCIVTSPLEGSGDSRPKGAEAVLKPTDDWAKEAKATLAINANFFGKIDGGKGTSHDYASGQFADIIGLSVCEGKTGSPPRGFKSVGDPALIIMKSGLAKAMLVSDLGAANAAGSTGDNVQWAVAGVGKSETDSVEGTLLVTGGVNTGATARVQPSVKHPRTAAGASSDGSRLILVVIDGRQPAHSEGATLGELADLMIKLGCSDAVNLDGGGSSAFVFTPPPGSDAKPVKNKPSDGHFRPVANHLGVIVKEPPKKAANP